MPVRNPVCNRTPAATSTDRRAHKHAASKPRIPDPNAPVFSPKSPPKYEKARTIVTPAHKHAAKPHPSRNICARDPSVTPRYPHTPAAPKPAAQRLCAPPRPICARPRISTALAAAAKRRLPAPKTPPPKNHPKPRLNRLKSPHATPIDPNATRHPTHPVAARHACRKHPHQPFPFLPIKARPSYLLRQYMSLSLR